MDFYMDKAAISELRRFHKKRLSEGWKELRNYRSRYRNIGNIIEVESYYVVVAKIYKDGQKCKIKKTWQGWSATTQNQINKILDTIHVHHINKKFWENLPLNKWHEI